LISSLYLELFIGSIVFVLTGVRLWLPSDSSTSNTGKLVLMAILVCLHNPYSIIFGREIEVAISFTSFPLGDMSGETV
jgi:hypothetical protein